MSNNYFIDAINALHNQSYHEAFSLFQKVSTDFEAEYRPYSFHYLAWMHEQGLGVNQNYDKAFALWYEAALLGVAESQVALAEYFLIGNGVAINLSKALCWYKISLDGLDEERLSVVSQKVFDLEKIMDNESKELAYAYIPEVSSQIKKN